MSPSHKESIKRLLMVKHHSIACGAGMFNLMSAYPSLEHGLGLIVVAQHHNVQWFNCTVCGDRH
jgi:hypothetical protein